jgi:hypothetical protein
MMSALRAENPQFKFTLHNIFNPDHYLLDDETKLIYRAEFRYKIPIFEDVSCLHPACERGIGGSVKKAVLDKNKVGGRRIFRIDLVELQQKLIIVERKNL